jgi:hypothetical protein
MKPILILLLSALMFSCGSAGDSDTSTSDSTSVDVPVTESTEAMPINNEYIYEITDKKTGKKKTLTQDEYLQSDYISNPSVEVKEKLKIH